VCQSGEKSLKLNELCAICLGF